MDLNKGLPLKKQQNIEIQQLWVPTTPVKVTSAGSQRSQPHGPSWHEPVVILANCELPCQFINSSLSGLPSHLRDSQHVSSLSASGHASTGSIVMLHSPVTSSGNVNSLECCTQQLIAERETKGIDLNVTPKKRSQRKKHRPKVFKEGNPSSTPKTATHLSNMDEKSRWKDNISCKRKYVRRYKDVANSSETENTSCKRKYVRRNKDVTHSLDTATNPLGEIVDAESKGKDKSLRRCLNFDLEEPQALEEFSVAMSVFKKAFGAHGRDVYDESVVTSLNMNVAVDSTRVQDQVAVKPSVGSSDINTSTSQSLNDCLQQISAPSAEVKKSICALDEHFPSLKSSVKHFKALAREAACFDLAPLKNSSKVSQYNLNPHGISDAPPEGTKRGHLSTDEDGVSAQKRIMHSYNSHGFSRSYDDRWGNSGVSPIFSPDLLYPTSNNLEMKQFPNNSLEFAFAEAQRLMAQEKLQISEHVLSFGHTEEHVLKYMALDSGQSSLSCSRSSTPVNQSRHNTYIAQPSTPEKLSQFSRAFESKMRGDQAHPETSEAINKFSKKSRGHPLYHMSSSAKHGYLEVQEAGDWNSISPAQKNAKIGFLATKSLNGKDLNPEITSLDCHSTSYLNVSASSSFSSRSLVPFIDSSDYIVQKQRHLNLSRCLEVAPSHPQKTIVPYGSHGYIMVPYERNFELTKRRRPRAKVDLDPESNRVWNLLMGKDCGDGEERLDVDKEQWWDEERRVFQGRVDSFIARMHLVQGDRRFSQWKGSVVDSVVGVFLTQNVSDHLSSSAFMALAANFPLQFRGKSIVPKGENVNKFMVTQNRCIRSLIDSPKLHRSLFDNGSFQHSLKVTISQNWPQKETNNCNGTLGSITSSSFTCYSRQKAKVKGSNLCKREVILCQKSTVNGSGIYLAELEDIRLSEDVITLQSSVVSSQNSISYNPNFNFKAENSLCGSVSNALGRSSVTEFVQMAERTGLMEVYNHGGGMISESQNQESILSIKNNPPITGQWDSTKDTFQPCNTDSSLHHAEFGLLDVLRPTKSCKSADLFNSKIMLNDANFSESDGSVAESTSAHKLLSSFNTTATIDSINKQTTRHITLSEMEFGDNLLSSSHKNTAEDIIDASKNENSHVCISLETEVLIRLLKDDENSTFKTEKTNDAVHALEKLYSHPQATVSNNEIVHNLDMPDKVGSILKAETCRFPQISPKTPKFATKTRIRRPEIEKSIYDWEILRKEVCCSKPAQERSSTTMDSLDWEAVRTADVSKIAETIRERGMNNVLAERIKEFLNRLVREHGSIDLEWLRDVPPDKVKDYLLSIRGLGLKSAECVRLLTLQQLAFPVDTNVGRICVRLGWVPLQPLPESLQLHLLELYPVLATIQKYLWPRLCKIDQKTLYELHYQMITFGKVFCTKSKPNCNSCPMRGECRHFASAFASARLALPASEEKCVVSLTTPLASEKSDDFIINSRLFPQIEGISNSLECTFQNNCEPIIEEPASPEPECQETLESAIEDAFYEDPDEIPTIKLNIKEFTQNLQKYIEENIELQDGSLSKALVALTPEVASIPMPKLKNVSRLRTEHQVYEIPDTHPLLEGLDPREPDDPSPYLLAIWTPGETEESTEPLKADCNLQDVDKPCERSARFACNNMRLTGSHKVRGTLLIPCRTAVRGSFPLNGTYFQVNEVIKEKLLNNENDYQWRSDRYLLITIPAVTQFMFQEIGYGTCLEGLFILEPQYLQYFEV